MKRLGSGIFLLTLFFLLPSCQKVEEKIGDVKALFKPSRQEPPEEPRAEPPVSEASTLRLDELEREIKELSAEARARQGEKPSDREHGEMREEEMWLTEIRRLEDELDRFKAETLPRIATLEEELKSLKGPLMETDLELKKEKREGLLRKIRDITHQIVAIHDVVILKNGGQIKGYILHESPKGIQIETFEGIKTWIGPDDFSEIQRMSRADRERIEHLTEKLEELNWSLSTLGEKTLTSQELKGEHGENIKTDPSIALVYLRMGRREEERGNLKQAASNYRQAIAFNPSLKEAEERLKKIESSL